jgi:hypothetical protein
MIGCVMVMGDLDQELVGGGDKRHTMIAPHPGSYLSMRRSGFLSKKKAMNSLFLVYHSLSCALLDY